MSRRGSRRVGVCIAEDCGRTQGGDPAFASESWGVESHWRESPRGVGVYDRARVAVIVIIVGSFFLFLFFFVFVSTVVVAVVGVGVVGVVVSGGLGRTVHNYDWSLIRLIGGSGDVETSCHARWERVSVDPYG